MKVVPGRNQFFQDKFDLSKTAEKAKVLNYRKRCVDDRNHMQKLQTSAFEITPENENAFLQCDSQSKKRFLNKSNTIIEETSAPPNISASIILDRPENNQSPSSTSTKSEFSPNKMPYSSKNEITSQKLKEDNSKCYTSNDYNAPLVQNFSKTESKIGFPFPSSSGNDTGATHRLSDEVLDLSIKTAKIVQKQTHSNASDPKSKAAQQDMMKKLYVDSLCEKNENHFSISKYNQVCSFVFLQINLTWSIAAYVSAKLCKSFIFWSHLQLSNSV